MDVGDGNQGGEALESGPQDGPGGGGPDPDMAAGSGWGGSVGGNLGGKPGESQMAQSASQQDRYGESMGSVEGFNENNPTQSLDEMQNAQRTSDFLGFAAPALAGVAVPGFGGIMGMAKTANNVINNGMSLKEAAGQYVGGQINGFANKATGGILGNAQMALSAAKSLGADVPSLNIGKEVVGALGMGPSGKSYGGAQHAQAATSAGDYVAMGLDSEGWTKRTGETT